MSHQEQIIHLLGYIKSTIEWLCSIAAKDKNGELFELFADFEQELNQKIQRIL